MPGLFGLDGQTTLLIAAGLLFTLWWAARSPRLVHGNAVLMNVFCLRCNSESRVQRGAPKCTKCGSQQVSVLRV